MNVHKIIADSAFYIRSRRSACRDTNSFDSKVDRNSLGRSGYGKHTII